MADAARRVRGIVGKGCGNCLLAGPHLHGIVIGRSCCKQAHELTCSTDTLHFIIKNW